MVGRSINQYTFKKAPPPKREPELVMRMSIRRASCFKVKIGRIEKSLGWLARNSPHKLEDLMESAEPGTKLFSALCIVYNLPHLYDRINNAVDRRNRKCQEGTRAGLARRRDDDE